MNTLETTVGTPPAEFFAMVLPTIDSPISMEEVLTESARAISG